MMPNAERGRKTEVDEKNVLKCIQDENFEAIPDAVDAHETLVVPEISDALYLAVKRACGRMDTHSLSIIVKRFRPSDAEYARGIRVS
jgi:phosphoribosyl-ATP pyrophosphohydrolase